jgi:hypothetical protein
MERRIGVTFHWRLSNSDGFGRLIVRDLDAQALAPAASASGCGAGTFRTPAF